LNLKALNKPNLARPNKMSHGTSLLKTDADKPKRFYLDLAHGQMHGRMVESADKPWIVLLHQSPSASIMFEALIPHLSAYFSVIALDNPGFGQSDPIEAPSVAAFGDCVVQALGAFDISSAFLFGHHTGAAIAAYLGVHEAGLCAGIAMCGPPALTPEQRKMLPAMAPVEQPQPDGAHLARMWAKLRSKETNAPPELSTREVGLAFSASSTRAAYQGVADYDFMADLATLTCPLLLFAGDRDSLVDYLPAAAQAAPHATIVKVEDAGGYICDLRPQFVASLLTDFFLRGGHEV
jgi:haloalkane dehalogenase